MSPAVPNLVEHTAARVAEYGEAEWQARVNLAACYRLIDHFGMCDLISNHVSARIPDTDDFLINPFGMMYEEITASSLIRVDLEGRVLHNPNADYTINQAGYVIHSAIHAARADVGCVIHTHTVAGVAVSALDCGLLPLAQSNMRFADVRYHDFEGVAFDEDEKVRLVADLGDGDSLVLRNHGLLVACADVPQAFNAIYRLERACQIQVTAQACNTPIRMPDAELVQRAHQQYRSNPAARGRQPQALGIIEWPAMLRLLDRRDPGYRC